MNKKRILMVSVLVLIVALMATMLVACGKPRSVKVPNEYFPANFKAVDYSKMEVVSDMDSFDLLNEVYNTWCNDKGYKRTQYFSFSAEPAGMKTITNFTKEIYKRDGDELFREQVVVQDTAPFAPDKYEVSRFLYNDATKEAKSAFASGKDVVPAKGSNVFAVAKMPKYKNYTGKDIAKKVSDYTVHMTTYDWNNKDNLANKDYNVYKDDKGNLRFTITIDCSKPMMNDVHFEARDEFIEKTGADKGTLNMRKNTTIDYVIGEVNGVKKILAWRRTEMYEGKKSIVAGITAPIPAQQTCIETFSYSEKDYKIADKER